MYLIRVQSKMKIAIIGLRNSSAIGRKIHSTPRTATLRLPELRSLDRKNACHERDLYISLLPMLIHKNGVLL